MVTKKQVEALGKAIGFLAVVDSKGLVALLVKHKTQPTDLSYSAINSATVKAMANPSFAEDFKKLLEQNLSSNFSGEYKNADGFFSTFNFGDVLGSATTIYSGIAQSKAQQDLLKAQANLQADATQSAIAQGQLQLEAERIRLEQIKAQQSSPNNTFLYIGLGVLGLVVVGGIIYAVAKK